MKKNKILIAAGTISLSIVGFLTSHANIKKFVAAYSLYYTRATVSITLFKGASISAANSFLTTTFIPGRTLIIQTGSNGILTKVFAIKNSSSGTLSKTVFVKH